MARLLNPYYGTCGRCGRPWNVCKPHTTDYKIGYGCFPLCEDCWGELTPEKRLPYYRKLYDRWEREGTIYNYVFNRDWFNIKKAVLADK